MQESKIKDAYAESEDKTSDEDVQIEETLGSEMN
jgi:hypothetical protein